MYGDIKQIVRDGTGIGPEGLHVLLATLLFLLLFALLRRPLAALGVVVLLQALNEVLDVLDDRAAGLPTDGLGVVSDTVWSLIVPVPLAIALRLYQQHRRQMRRRRHYRRR
ncbi:hypothetical protein SAMN05880590_113122 [Rhizobium sp. RU35A]|uniref:hypothetical protein n=1 Tax=Rhizobium sp. RU35A TaxID=1907414 RepID=UPI0009550EFB|nr:hypothetical protein [Rhizobium sp. RU35A]SIR19271.1 hypothetical protein SAMN05880590_113122 [Rhizobium sp. RU35A]